MNAIDGSGVFGDFLIKAVAEVMGWIGGDDECFFAGLSLEGG